MTKQQLEQFRKWFYDYVATFYGNDELVNDNIKLKEDHTRRMCKDVLLISQELELNDEQQRITETIVLFHDVGRFEQFRKYRTYNDVGTESHSLLGLKVLADKKILDCLDKKEKEIIETAIRLHGEKDLPGGLGGETELFAKLIRDIDKLDIYYVMISRIGDLRSDPQKCFAIFGCPANDKYSKHIIKAILDCRTISYGEFKTLNDIILGLLGWIFDINFAATLKKIKKRRLFEQLILFLPHTEDINRATEHILQKLNERITKA